MRYCIRNQTAPHAHVVAAPVAPPAPSAPVFSTPPTGGSGYNGAYGYGGGDGPYSGRSGGPGYDIPCYPPQQTPPSYSGRSGGPGYISRIIRCSKHLRHTAVAAAALAMISRVIRRSSQPHAPSLALSGTRGTTTAIVQRRHSSHAPAPSVALAGSRGALAAMDRP